MPDSISSQVSELEITPDNNDNTFNEIIQSWPIQAQELYLLNTQSIVAIKEYQMRIHSFESDENQDPYDNNSARNDKERSKEIRDLEIKITKARASIKSNGE